MSILILILILIKICVDFVKICDNCQLGSAHKFDVRLIDLKKVAINKCSKIKVASQSFFRSLSFLSYDPSAGTEPVERREL